MDEIKKLIEDRQMMATKKQLSSKLTIIASNLGSGIYGDTGFGAGLGGSSLDTEAWMLPEEKDEEILDAEDQEYSDMGYLFDSLNMGHNFEIRLLTHEREIRATYNGYVVYLEEEGKLKAYVPNAIWENLVDKLYLQAKPKEDDKRIATKEVNQKRFMQQAAEFMKELRDSWGI